jgi:hypothetical protein
MASCVWARRKAEAMKKEALVHAVDSIRTTASMMQADPHFECTFEERPTVIDEDIDVWEEWAQSQPGMSGYRMPAPLRSLYLVTGGFRWAWRYLRDQPAVVIQGSAEIVSMIALYQRDDETDRPLAMIYSAPRPFDLISEREWVSLRFTPETHVMPVLVHVHAGGGESTLQLPLDEYLPKLAHYRAIDGWQSLFHENPTQRGEVTSRLDATLKRVFR